MNAPNKITSQEYKRPYRPRLIAGINLIGRALARAGFRGSSLEEKSLMSAAMRKTGLADFGDPSFRDRMRILIDALEREARLNFFGRFMVRQNLVRFLENRLKIEAAIKSNPELLRAPMEDPVIIVGLQRTGTTMLHRLLASDTENFRHLASWEAINPAPLGERKAGGEDPRVRMAVIAQKALRYMAPDFFAIHPVEAHEPEEDCLLFDFDFWSTVPEATMRVPAFSRWLEEQDHTPAYRYFRGILLYLYGQNPRGRWILKTPQHMEHFDEIFRIFPGAKIIHTHRDPSRVVASFCSMVSHAYGVFSDTVDPREIGAHWSRKAEKMVGHSMEMRDRVGPGRIIDIHYADLMRDPAGCVRRIYDFIGIPFTADHESRVRRWGDSNPQHKHGTHRYRLEDFGLTKEGIRRSFGRYCAAFNVPEEAGHE